MNGAHLHLLLNHVPILGSIFGLALFAYATLRKSDELRRAALGFFAVSGLFAIAAYMTGDPAEHAITRSLPNVRELIHEHEEAASFALTGSILLGLFSGFGLFRFRGGRAFPNWFTLTTAAVAIIVGAMMVRTGNLGGQIRHPEIVTGTAPQLDDTEMNTDMGAGELHEH